MYDFADHLRTSRTIVSSGQTSACYDADFYSFGGERPYTNTCGENYKFTGKERDTESGLDNFQARYGSSLIGRFMSPDWSDDAEAAPYANKEDPQTLNSYTYVRNNPLNGIDPDGHLLDCGGQTAVSTGDTSMVVHANCIEIPIETVRAWFSTALDKTGDVLQQLGHAAWEWSFRPRTPGCVASHTLAGSGAGALAVGAVGLAGGPFAEISVPAGAGVGGIGGGATGWVAGMNVCSTGQGGGGGGGGGDNQRQNEQAKAARQEAERRTGKNPMDKAQQQKYHRAISGMHYTYEELVKAATEILEGRAK
jgi:RHS repeat-associated protein